MVGNVSQWTAVLEEVYFRQSENLALRELGAEKIGWFSEHLCRFIRIRRKTQDSWALFYHFCETEVPSLCSTVRSSCSWRLTIVRRSSRYRMKWEDGKRSKYHTTFIPWMRQTEKFEGKKLSSIQNAVSRTLAGMMVQLMQMIRDALTRSYLFGPLRAVEQTSLW